MGPAGVIDAVGHATADDAAGASPASLALPAREAPAEADEEEDAGADEEEEGYRFGAHSFTPGEYVSIRDDEGELRTFKVIAVTPA